MIRGRWLYFQKTLRTFFCFTSEQILHLGMQLHISSDACIISHGSPLRRLIQPNNWPTPFLSIVISPLFSASSLVVLFHLQQ